MPKPVGRAISKRPPFLPFKKALLHARSLKLKSYNEWEVWRKSGERQANMPSRPDQVYKHVGWRRYGIRCVWATMRLMLVMRMLQIWATKSAPLDRHYQIGPTRSALPNWPRLQHSKG